MKPIRHVTDVNLIAMAYLIKAMRQGATSEQMAELSGFTEITCNRYAAALHQAGEAHIANLLPDSRGLFKTRVWKLGPGVDMKPPPARTRASRQKEQRYRERSVRDSHKVVFTMVARVLTQGKSSNVGTEEHQSQEQVGSAQPGSTGLRHEDSQGLGG
jgi:hypothetical protein